MKRITFHPDADAEIGEAARYYEDRSSGLGSELLGEVERALALISRNPEACQRNPQTETPCWMSTRKMDLTKSRPLHYLIEL